MLLEERLGPMLLTRWKDGRPNPLAAQMNHLPFPEVAATTRPSARPCSRCCTFTLDHLKDSTPQILAAFADALASDDPEVIRELVECAPSQGVIL
jgi:hypothetical protein